MTRCASCPPQPQKLKNWVPNSKEYTFLEQLFENKKCTSLQKYVKLVLKKDMFFNVYYQLQIINKKYLLDCLLVYRITFKLKTCSVINLFYYLKNSITTG